MTYFILCDRNQLSDDRRLAVLLRALGEAANAMYNMDWYNEDDKKHEIFCCGCTELSMLM